MRTVESPPFSPRGVATGIGSLPFEDPREALALILTELPECPHWPQLPRRSRQEQIVYQFLQPLADCGMLVNQNDRWFFDTSRETREIASPRFIPPLWRPKPAIPGR